MQTNATAKGILRHHFWGTYYATIGLQFESEETAAAALGKLGGLWRVGEKSKRVLVWHGTTEQLEICKAQLGTFGADVEKIASLKYSIDSGEPFDVSIPVDVVHPDQLSLFG